MNSGLKAILVSVPIEQWQVQSQIIAGWYDWTLEGVSRNVL